ncbi:hypothetical protein B0T10DRAFT_539011 [Thelonectria olida]|uniref:Rhodopsin domain-containing protein n=1 Tax=Thelonectria olida TaxID=1576542 RepID=A0A9P8W2D9_9HYPO|nr:hypothetical protein B0T10DRAFT_539011 [Thelonectria olida]
MLLPREHETPFNKAPLIRALAGLLMVITVLSAITRIATRLVTIRTLKVDDTLVAAATAVVIAQSIAVIAQGANGLGKLYEVDNNHVSSILKAQYASDVLYIIALCLGKISATRTILDMAPREKRRLILATEVVIGLWAASSIIVSFFQCSLPNPWDYLNSQCINRTAFWIYVDAFNIVTDIAITGILFKMFIALKTSASKKALVIGVFGCRVLIFPPIICHMYYYKRAVDSRNPIFDMWKPTVIVQVIQCMSIMATCIPYLKPFLDSLESGQMNAGDLRGTRSKGSSSRSRSGYASAQTHTHTTQTRTLNTARGIPSVATLASNASHRRQKYEMFDLDNKYTDRGNKNKVGNTATAEGGGSWDRESHKSHTSQTVLVQQTVRVEVDNRDSIR